MNRSLRHGVVTGFDAGVGLGTIRSDDGTSYRFHGIELLDGSRAVDVGQRVVFAELARLGHVEAGRIHKV